MRDRFRRRQPPFPKSASGVAWGIVACLLGVLLPQALAHPVSLTSVFINVKEDKITAELNMLVEDLILYYWLETDENFRFPRELLKKHASNHKEFLARHLHLRDRDGNRFEGEVVDIDFSELSEEGIHIDDLMQHAIRYHFEFPFDERPEFLTVSQDFGGEEPPVPAEMGVRFFHHGVHMEAVMLAHGSAHTIRLDWDAGWEHARDDLEAARERLRQRQEEALGITSYSRVYSYVYITKTEVRHELLIPLLTLDTWLPLRREQSERMSVEEQRAIATDLFDFLKEHSRLEIDGEKAAPVLDRIVFFGPDVRDFARQGPERPVSMYNGRVGVILSFPRERPPEQIRFEWDFFHDRLPVFRPIVFAYDEEKLSPVLSRFERSFAWKSDQLRAAVELQSIEPPPPAPRLRVPLVSVAGGVAACLLGVAAIGAGRSRRRLLYGLFAGALAVGAVSSRSQMVAVWPHPWQAPLELSEDESAEVFRILHGNMYRAFEFSREEQIYDALEASVAGQLLEDIYLQIRRKLTLEEQGGAISRVSEVDLLEGRLELGPGAPSAHSSFRYRSRWNVTGTVEHWGHIHTRTNQYEALFTVEGLSSGWRITGFEPLQEERIGMQIRLRQ